MTATAKQIVYQEAYAWLEREDYLRFTEVQRLEAATRIWEFGKWCNTQASASLGYKPQLVLPSPRESTWWDGLPMLTDDEAMRIHEATARLGQEDAQGLESIKALYVWRLSAEEAARRMRMRKERFLALRRLALKKIYQHLLTREP